MIEAKRGRPKVREEDRTVPFYLGLSRWLHDDLKAEAERRGWTVTEAAREAIADWLAVRCGRSEGNRG